MQSYLQYKRFGKRVQQQLERDKHRYDRLRAANDGDPSATAPVQHDAAVQDTHTDLEKGDQRRDSPQDQSQDHSQEREEIEEDDHQYPLSTSESSNDEPAQKPEHENMASLGVSLSRASTRSNKSMGTRMGHALSGVNVRDRTTHEGGDRSRQVFVVDFEGDNDPMNPHNWTFRKRLGATSTVACIAFIVGWASSIDSSVLRPASAEFGVSQVTESLATGMWLILSQNSKGLV